MTLHLPLIGPEERAERLERCGRGKWAFRQHERYKRQIKRIVAAAADQGGLLTLAELSLILGVGYELVRGCVREIETEQGQPLPLKGYKMDQGSQPSHKGLIIRLFEQGLAPPDIARQSGHNLKSVERYLKDYERVRLLLQQGLNEVEMSAIGEKLRGLR